MERASVLFRISGHARVVPELVAALGVCRGIVDGTGERLVTRFDGDILGVAAVDTAGGWLYFTASPDAATARYLYRSRLDGAGGIERLTPASQPGTHSYDISPDRRWAGSSSGSRRRRS